MAVTSILGSLLFGEKPELPPLESIDLQEEQQKAIRGNIQALPSATDLASRVNAFNQSERLKQLRSIFPNLDKDLATGSAAISDMLEGRVPEDVGRRLQDASAAFALGRTGTPLFDAGINRNELGRQLGLSSLSTIQQGLDNFQRWTATASGALGTPLMDVSGLFVSPSQQAAFDVSERNTFWNYDWFRAQHAAQPEPWEASVQGLLDWAANTGLSAASMGVGGGFGGGAGRAASTGSASMSGIDVDSLLRSFRS